MRKLKRNGSLKQSEKRTAVSNAVGKLTLKELHLIFMRYKRSEGLSYRTLNDYETTFGYLIDYVGGDISKNEMTTDLFLGYKDYMINDKQYKPNTTFITCNIYTITSIVQSNIIIKKVKRRIFAPFLLTSYFIFWMIKTFFYVYTQILVF